MLKWRADLARQMVLGGEEETAISVPFTAEGPGTAAAYSCCNIELGGEGEDEKSLPYGNGVPGTLEVPLASNIELGGAGVSWKIALGFGGRKRDD